MNKLGVYEIRNIKNEKVYIGSGQIENRFYRHKYQLKNNRHYNDHLQRSWNKYGEKYFNFSSILKCDESRLLEYEQYWMDRYKSYYPENGYNIAKKADKSERSEEVIDKIKENMEPKYGEEHPNWKGEKLEKVCIECDDKYRVTELELEFSKYCSKTCMIDNIVKNGKRKGSSNSNSKLSEDDVINIKLLLKTSDKTMKEISELFSVSRACIDAISCGKNWSHIEI